MRSGDEVVRERLAHVLVDGVAAQRVDERALVAHEVRRETCAVDREENELIRSGAGEDRELKENY